MATTFSRQLAKALRDRDMSQNALSIYAGVDQSTVSKLVKGKVSNPGMDLVVVLAKALDVSLDWLVNGEQWRETQLTPDEDLLVALYRDAPDDIRRSIMLETMRGLAGK